MSAQPTGRPDEPAERHASAVAPGEAEIEATLATHRVWVAAGRPSAVSHEEAMTELLGGGE
jgi:hypothetical protein